VKDVYELGQRIQDALQAVDPQARVYIYGGAFRCALTDHRQNTPPDFLVVSKRLDLETAKSSTTEVGGNPTHCALYPSVRDFLSTRHFTVDQGALGLDGEVAFATDRCRADLRDNVIRPTRYAATADPARRGQRYSATLCGRAVRLANLYGFEPCKTLARYIRSKWQSLLDSRSFRWHATKMDLALESSTAVPSPWFLG